jgi:hypothetical protein
MKKIFAGFFVTIFSIFSLLAVAPTPTVSADTCASDVDANFLNFPTWYRGLCKNGTDELMDFKGESPTKIIWPVALNILDILLRLVGIMAVGFVIWGGIRYVMSNGEPEQAKKAMDTILKSVIGMVIAMVAAVVVSFIVGMAIGGASSSTNPAGLPGTLTGPCPVNTNDLGLYDNAHDGDPNTAVSVRLCELTSITGKDKGAYDPEIFNASGAIVSAQYADAFEKMGEAAKADGIQLTGKGIRSYEQQVYFWNCYQNQNCNGGHLAAKPGTSNHEIGNAIDFNTSGGALDWLRAHGSEYGFKELSTEVWHWSPGG